MKDFKIILLHIIICSCTSFGHNIFGAYSLVLAPPILIAINIEEALPLSDSTDDILYYHAMFLGGIERMNYEKQRISLLYSALLIVYCILLLYSTFAGRLYYVTQHLIISDILYISL